MPIGFRIYERNQVAPKGLVDRFAKLPVANVSDSMSRLAAGGPDLRPMHASGGMAGVALTVKCRHRQLRLKRNGNTPRRKIVRVVIRTYDPF